MKFYRRSKFRNVKTTVGGLRFDSKAEARRYGELLLLQQAGEIVNLRTQVPYELIPKQAGERSCVYVADFVYDLRSLVGGVGWVLSPVVEDVKGVLTAEYVIKRKLMLERHGIRIIEVNARKRKARAAPRLTTRGAFTVVPPPTDPVRRAMLEGPDIGASGGARTRRRKGEA